MNWFQQVQQRIRSLREQNDGDGKTEHVDGDKEGTTLLPKDGQIMMWDDKKHVLKPISLSEKPISQRYVGFTEHFTIYNASLTTDKFFMIMPRISMYIPVEEIEKLNQLLSMALADYYNTKDI